MPDCSRCFYCTKGEPHPDERHRVFHRISDKLLKPESLDPKDWVPMEACTQCGHVRQVQLPACKLNTCKHPSHKGDLWGGSAVGWNQRHA